MFNLIILNLSFFLMFLLFSATSCGEVNQKSSEQPGRSGEEPPSGQSSQSELLVKLIAHRGGIVNEIGIENSRATMEEAIDRKSTRLNSSHVAISYAVFCLKKKK